jgi:hypothetical protein
MPNPWDPYPFPDDADEDMNRTCYGVGLVTTSWEAIEFELARLYSSMVGDPDGHSIRLYGQPRIFNERLSLLARTGEAFFVRFPNQSFEGEFGQIVAVCLGFSSRRNEVAHGIVMNVRGVTFFRSRVKNLDKLKVQALLVPPYHILRSHNEDGMPNYAYNCAQLEDLALKLHEVEKAIRHFRRQI